MAEALSFSHQEPGNILPAAGDTLTAASHPPMERLLPAKIHHP